MLGKITFDKSSMVMSYFLYTIWIIKENGGKLLRSKFEEEMASLVGVSICNEDGKINRTSYNKSKFPRYFGFVESCYDNNKKEYLCLTYRGEKLSKIIGENLENAVDSRYYLTDKEQFAKLIFYSLFFDSFGKNNCGAEQSNSDVEPPKLVFKVLQKLGSATANEIYYVMFGVNGNPPKSKAPLFSSFEEAIKNVQEKRTMHYSYEAWIKSWGLENLVSDCKIINILGPKGFNLLEARQDSYTKELVYSISELLNEECKSYIEEMKPFYRPLFHIQEFTGTLKNLQDWMNYAVYGKCSSNRFIFKIDASHVTNNIVDNPIFCEALKAAYALPKKAIFLEFVNADHQDILNFFGKEDVLLERIDNFQDNLNGWSEQAIDAPSLYSKIKATANKSALNVLAPNTIRLPSNFNITGVKINAN